MKRVQKEERQSRVTSGQMKAPEYIVSRYVAASSLTRNICYLHKTPCLIRLFWVYLDYLITSIAHEWVRKQAWTPSESGNYLCLRQLYLFIGCFSCFYVFQLCFQICNRWQLRFQGIRKGRSERLPLSLKYVSLNLHFENTTAPSMLDGLFDIPATFVWVFHLFK